jgi:transposase
MWLIKLFELEISTRRIADQVRLSYPTVLKAVTLLRAAILMNDNDSDRFIQDEPDIYDIWFRKRPGKRNVSVFNDKIPVIGIMRKDGMIKVKYIEGDDVEFKHQKIFNDNKLNPSVCDARFQNHDYLMCCDYKSLKVSHGRSSSNGKFSINGLESFLCYARERLFKFHGISRERFFLYMKEMEFRYNHRQEDLFILFSQSLCTLLPFQLPKP